MPHFTLTWTPDGLALPVMVGLTGKDTMAFVTAGLPVARPALLQGLIDTASDITVVAAPILSRFGLIPIATHTTRGMGGSLPVRLFEVSLSIPPTVPLQAPLLVLPHLVVMEWVSPLPGIECLVGLDVLAHLLTILDGPRQEFTLGD